MKNLTLALLAACAASSLALPALGMELTESWRLEGFQMPESVIYDTANERIIIGNMVAMGAEAGENGYLSLVSPDGEMVEEQWVTGLQDPRGMAIVDGQLFVADNMGFHIVSLDDGTLVETVTMQGAAFPNDVTADDDGNVYISDMFGQTIWRYADGEASIWFGPDDGITFPNGLFAHDGQIIVGSMGADMGENFTFGTPGGLYGVDGNATGVTPLDGATEIGAIDGVAAIGDIIVFNDNPTGTIYGWRDGDTVELATVGAGAADISAHESMVLVPQMQQGALIAMSLTQ
ncbi:ATP/GTP-binding protein [uncultured Pelagibacterium sp.]|uniref:ATP/GTP-binding protein n=1 Tax=uncultured Pelagibacterium sp. TaxID=1159875 RepID=UPI0030D929BC|tara:strand:- start:1734 stop:2603 length:870 start_codon:yes stop_codon:yes gene_type:complete